MVNAIIDLDNFALNNYGYITDSHQSQLIVASAGLIDLATSEGLNDKYIRIDIPDTDDFFEKAEDLATQVYNYVEAAFPYFSQQTIYENVLFASCVGLNDKNVTDLEQRSGYFIGEFLPAQQSIQRTDTIVEVVEQAGKAPVSDKYTNLDWAMFYLESLVHLDRNDADLQENKVGSRASRKAWDVVDGYRYATVRKYDLDAS